VIAIRLYLVSRKIPTEEDSVRMNCFGWKDLNCFGPCEAHLKRIVLSMKACGIVVVVAVILRQSLLVVRN
jgi:hypothetical protein